MAVPAQGHVTNPVIWAQGAWGMDCGPSSGESGPPWLMATLRPSDGVLCPQTRPRRCLRSGVVSTQRVDTARTPKLQTDRQTAPQPPPVPHQQMLLLPVGQGSDAAPASPSPQQAPPYLSPSSLPSPVLTHSVSPGFEGAPSRLRMYLSVPVPSRHRAEALRMGTLGWTLLTPMCPGTPLTPHIY